MVRIGRLLPFLAGLVVCSRALANPPITDRNYAIELYDGAAVGNAQVVGMGGAAVALAQGSSGTLGNPAASAVRPTTDSDDWSWDYHLDYLVGSFSNDYDNNGIYPTNTSGTGLVTIGASLRYHDWATAFTLTDQFAPVDGTIPTPQGDTPLQASALRLQLAIAKWIPQLDTAIGVSVQSAQFDLAPACAGPGCQNLFNISGVGLEAGATYIPRWENFRIAAELSSGIEGGNVTSTCPDLASCDGFILPEQVVSPTRLAAGFAYRWADTAGNQTVAGFFRDEQSLTFAADLVIAGSSPNAYGLEAFGMKELQRAGRHSAWSPRAGVEYEWLPGRLRVRGGSYWEPGRFEGVGGRLHVTFGVELRALQFWFWGALRRGKLGLTADTASQYRNVGVSIGLWH